MNRSAVRIRPPAPESPFERTGFIIRRVRIRTCPVTLRRGPCYSVVRLHSLRIRPPAPESPFRRTGFIIRRVRIRTCPVTLRCGAPCYSVVRLHSLRIRRIFDFPSEKRVSVCGKFGIFMRCVVLSCNKLYVIPISLLSPRAVKFIIVVLIRFGRTGYDCR